MTARSVSRTAVGEFADADSDGLPSLSELDDRLQMFWVLRVAAKLGRAAMTPAEISDVLRDIYGIDLPRQRIEATLSAEKGTVVKRKVERRRSYQLMKLGADQLSTLSSSANFIDPERGYTGFRATHELLRTVVGELRVCDPYVDTRTLDMLAECENAGEMRLLTRNIKRADGLKQGIKAFEAEHKTMLQIRKAPDGILHDRYIIHDAGMLMFGTSLNGLGLKQSLVVALGPDVRVAALAAFESTWDTSQSFWPTT